MLISNREDKVGLLYSFPFLILVAVIVFGFGSFIIVSQQEAYIVERLGHFHKILNPSLSILILSIDHLAYKHMLKEIPPDAPSRVCITRDNTQFTVDGIIYFRAADPKLASYGSSSYTIAITQPTQTTLRPVIGRMELDKTFEEHDEINSIIVAMLDKAAVSWGIKVLRCEIEDLAPSQETPCAVQAQIATECKKHTCIAESEGRKIRQVNLVNGQREAEIQQSEGEAQAAINASNGEKAARIDHVQSGVEVLRLVAEANADATRQVAAAL